MKLRVKGNSVRLRLTRTEVARLDADGLVEESSQFGIGEVLKYSVDRVTGPDALRASFESGSLRIRVPAAQVRQWARSDDVGIYGECGALQISVEKDFRCLTRPEERFDPDVYPHPAADS